MNDFEEKLATAAKFGKLHGIECVLDFGDPQAEFAALQAGVGVVDFCNRTQIELAGDDSPAFLHNLCTNDIKRLTPGAGCEVFLTNVQGKIIGHGYVYRTPGGCLYETIPDVGEELLAYFDRYLFREQVEVFDRSPQWAELVVAGPEAANILQQAELNALPEEMYSHAMSELAGNSCAVRKVDFVAGPCFQLSLPRESVADVSDALFELRATPCGATAWEQARIMHGTLLYGIDITDDNLPQEVARDESAISFTKGCYIGQETVARIDALGHVNKTLCKLQVTGRTPAAGDELFAADDAGRNKAVGKVTSACAAPQSLHADGTVAFALGYLRRGSNMAGTVLQGDGFRVSVNG